MKRISLSIFIVGSFFNLNSQCWSLVASGWNFSLGIKTDGTIWAWGYNGNGQLGNGTSIDCNTPTQIGNFNNWKSISGGPYFSLAIKTDGTLWGWGQNDYGQLGDGTIISKDTPTQIGIDNTWKAIVIGPDDWVLGKGHTIALKTDNTLWAWGGNSFGQLGDGTTTDKQIPIQIGTDVNWASITTGHNHSLAIKTDGTLWAWGWNNLGQLGDGTTNDQIVPIQIGTATNWKIISAGNGYSLGIKTDGTLWAWGNGANGRLGDGTNLDQHTPIQIGNLTSWKYIYSGLLQSHGIKTDGTLWAWGYNNNGELGDGTYVTKSVPVQIGTNNNWELIASMGSRHLSGIQNDKTLWAWGNNFSGELGDGTNINKNEPVNISCIPSGIEELAYNSTSYKIYPNPSSTEIFINDLQNESIEKLTILDVTGKIVHEKKQSFSNIIVQNLQSGMYFLKFNLDGKTYLAKFVKE